MTDDTSEPADAIGPVLQSIQRTLTTMQADMAAGFRQVNARLEAIESDITSIHADIGALRAETRRNIARISAVDARVSHLESQDTPP